MIADIDFDVITDYVVTEASQLRENGAEIELNTHDSLLNGNYEYDEIINNKIVDAIFAVINTCMIDKYKTEFLFFKLLG